MERIIITGNEDVLYVRKRTQNRTEGRKEKKRLGHWLLAAVQYSL